MALHVGMESHIVENTQIFLDEDFFEIADSLDDFDGAEVSFDDLTTISDFACDSLLPINCEHIEKQIIVNQQEASSKYPNNIVPLPRVVKNDLRRSFSHMYMGMINGGDFQQVQDFSRMFIRPDTVFSARIQSREQFLLPPYLHGWGPRAHMHYMIGIYVMYPDVAVTFSDTKIITSNQWSGTKIVISWLCKMTKTHHIPVDCWMPPEESAERMYQEPSVDRMMTALSLKDTPINSISNGSDAVQLKKKRKRSLNSALVLQNRCEPVPLHFVQNLQTTAAPFSPMSVTAEGTYTFMLDENHHVTSIALDVRHPK